jgi:hypothetical protein
MHVANDWGNVRIVYDGSPFDVAYDIRTEWLVDGEWKLYEGFNSLSNDYAFTSAKDAATRAIKQLAANAAVLPVERV